MDKATSAIVEVVAVSALFFGAIACSLSSLSKQTYDLVEVRFCPTSANGRNSKEQKRLDERYCQVPRYVLRESWDTRGLFGSVVPLRDDVKFKRLLPAHNPHQHWALTGTALCLAGISAAIATRNTMLQNKYYAWLEYLKTTGFTTWLQNKSQRELSAFNNQLNIRLKADIAQALDAQSRIQAGLTDIESVQQSTYKQQALIDIQHELIIAELRRKIAEEKLGESKAEKERQKMNSSNESVSTSSTQQSNKFELEERYQWIYRLLKLPFRVLSGEQGSGKSTLERLMIRLLKDDGWFVIIINPETNPAVWEGVHVLADAGEINAFFAEFPKTIQARMQQARTLKIDEDDYLDYIKDKSALDGKVAIFLMESNTYEVHGVDPTLWANFLKQSLTNIRKWGFTVCLTAHSDNQTSISSKLQGFSRLIDSAPRVDCIAIACENGEAVSSGRAMLKMKGVRDENPEEVELYHYPKSKKF